MNLYELNQAGYASLPNMTSKAKRKAKNNIFAFLEKNNLSKYFMILNNEIRYYTVYTYANNYYKPDEMAEEMMSVMEELGSLKSVEVTDNMVEFWITGKDGVCRMYACFPYDRGVIEV